MWLPPSGETQSTPAPAASPSLPQGADGEPPLPPREGVCALCFRPWCPKPMTAEQARAWVKRSYGVREK
jgi:hypothetical protein